MSFQDYLDYRKDATKKKISEHFTMFEIINSDTAIAKKIDNRPTAQVVTNATALIKNVLEKVRVHFNSPVTVNSIYRSPDLNKAVGGAVDKNGKPKSQHCFGQAADITVKNHSVQEVFDYIKGNLIYDQLILEESNNIKWIHVSFSLVKNRKQSLKLVNGKYLPA